jgi:hypothetical protein
MASKWFKNTFAPNVRTKIVSTEQIILLLFHRVVLFKDLPDEVQEAVSIKMQEKVASSSINTTVDDNNNG